MPGSLTRLSASEDYAPQFHSVKCQLCICVWGCSRNISYMPRFRFKVLDMHWQEYICYWSLGIFKRTFHVYKKKWGGVDILPYWSLAWSLAWASLDIEFSIFPIFLNFFLLWCKSNKERLDNRLSCVTQMMSLSMV